MDRLYRFRVSGEARSDIWSAIDEGNGSSVYLLRLGREGKSREQQGIVEALAEKSGREYFTDHGEIYVVCDTAQEAAMLQEQGREPLPPPIDAPKPFPLLAVSGIAAFLILAAIILVAANPTISPAERSAWETASQSNTISSYETYIGSYPKGYFRQKADAGISNRRSLIESAWETAQSVGTVAAMQEFLDKYAAEGLHESEARQRLATLKDEAERRRKEREAEDQKREAERQERELAEQRERERAAELDAEAHSSYLKAIGTPRKANYEEFLQRYGNSNYADDVRRRLARCHIESNPQYFTSRQPLQTNNSGYAMVPSSACQLAANFAAVALRNSCQGALENGRVLNTQVRPEWFGGYTCYASAAADCIITTSSMKETEVCP